MRCIRRFVFLALALSVLSGCATTAPESTPSSPQAGSTPSSAAAPSTDAATSSKSALEYERALAAMNAERYTEAERELNALITREPSLSGPYANLGILYFRTGRSAEAVDALHQAIRLNARNPAYYNVLGMVHRNAGRFNEAESAYARAIELDPNYAYGHLNLGILYDIYLNKPEQALVQYERYRALVPEEATAVAKWIADIKQRSGRAAEPKKAGGNG